MTCKTNYMLPQNHTAYIPFSTEGQNLHLVHHWGKVQPPQSLYGLPFRVQSKKHQTPRGCNSCGFMASKVNVFAVIHNESLGEVLPQTLISHCCFQQQLHQILLWWGCPWALPLAFLHQLPDQWLYLFLQTCYLVLLLWRQMLQFVTAIN